MKRIVALVAVLGLLAPACGDDGATDAGPVPDRPETAVSTGGEAATGGPTTTSAPAQTGTTEVSVWLVRNELLEEVRRTVPRVPRIGAEAVKALLAGPTAAESRNGFDTAVPRETRFRDLVIDATGIAKIDLSRDFESGGGSLGLTLRLAQVTCTVTQFSSVRGVRFALGGELVSVFSGNGIVLDKPVHCGDYLEVLHLRGEQITFAGIWPFTTKAELDAYAAGSDRTFRDPVATAREFTTRYLGMDDPVSFAFRSTGAGAGEVPMGFRFGEGRTPVSSPQPTFTVVLGQLGAQPGSGPWAVVGVTSPNIVVSRPGARDKAASPVRVAGQAHAFEGTVNVEVREDGMLAGQSLGRGVVTGGGDALRPFSGDITFRSPTKPAGAIVFVERSAADGQGILRAAVVRVRF